MSTVNLTEVIRDFPQLLQSEYFNNLEEVTTESKHTSHYAFFLAIPLVTSRHTKSAVDSAS